jgi:hypothetical protein
MKGAFAEDVKKNRLQDHGLKSQGNPVARLINPSINSPMIQLTNDQKMITVVNRLEFDNRNDNREHVQTRGGY